LKEDKAKVEVEAKAAAQKEIKWKEVVEKEVAKAREDAKKVSKEAEDRVVDEERRKKNVEMRNNGTQPMDIDIQEVSTTDTNIEAPFDNLGLGFWAPFQQSEVPNLRSFTCDNKTGKIMQEHVKKVPTIHGMLVSFLTQVPVTWDVMENPIAMATSSIAFTSTNEDNIRRPC
jgi:hypothetical protein